MFSRGSKMAKRKRNPYKLPNNKCTNAYISTDMKKTLKRLQRFYQMKENKKNPRKPNDVTLAWTSQKLNKVVNKILKREIK